jgi:hypothetical protein
MMRNGSARPGATIFIFVTVLIDMLTFGNVRHDRARVTQTHRELRRK